ncbi:hypothetical protein VT98_13032 [Candidatus Electrothrix communis]|uniref:Uncharacterized protein n=1 Tax=Candidatus Electrothrix communis TaxID=1859133 RepID=A0A3S3SMC8_9BACT|nr:hypothetical protein [Desulfobulbus sp. US4]RWX45911.1 hypothetical protein VT98_13032 [Candidatus Electrothrix communis]
MIPNLRDVGKTVNIICGEEIMNEGVLYRGGTVNKLSDESELPDVKTILNLRTEADQIFPSKKTALYTGDRFSRKLSYLKRHGERLGK